MIFAAMPGAIEQQGHKDSVTTQIEALGTVYQHFQEPEKRSLARKLEETAREMERARMTAEDLRGRMVSPYGTNHSSDSRRPLLSWRGFGPPLTTPAAAEAYAAMVHAERLPSGNDPEESESDSDDS